MLFLQTVPDTSSYMVAGYAIAFGTMALYVVSLALRFRNLKRDLHLLQEMEDDK